MAGRSILIVEDEYIVAHDIAARLEAMGYVVAGIAGSGEQTLEFLAGQTCDLVLLDVLLKGNLDGIQTAEMILRNKPLPVVFLTGCEDPQLLIRAKRARPYGYLWKPITDRALEVTLALALEHFQVKADLEQQAAHLRRMNEDVNVLYRELEARNSELVRSQAALVEKSKMSAVGTLAAGVAHEFNNILAMLKGYAQLQGEQRTDAADQPFVNVVKELTVRGQNVVKGLLDFARREDVQKKEQVDLTALIRQDLTLLSRRIEEAGVTLEADYAELPPVTCYPGQISQAFVNIVVNALDSMRRCSHRRLRIELRMAQAGDFWRPGLGDVLLAHNIGSAVLILVTDTGCGIPEDLKDHIFEPFVTSKGVISGGEENQPGTGLGLSITYGIVIRHGGCIYVDSRNGEGTTVTIALPV